MNGDEKYKVPESTKGDVVEALSKGVVSAIPYAGGFLVELLQIVIVPPLEKKSGMDERRGSGVEGARAESGGV